MSFDNESTIMTLQAMRRAEESAYMTTDYYAQQDNNLVTRPQHLTSAVDADGRSKMATWCLQVSKLCNFHAETVAIAMSYFDRYCMAEANALYDPHAFQLAAMTAFYTAVKIHEPQALSPQMMSRLSQGAYTVPEIEAMEYHICTVLNWRLNPPTAHAFVRELLSLIPSLDDKMSQLILDLAEIQINLAIVEYDFVTTPASTLAVAAVMNALESLGFGAASPLNRSVVATFKQVVLISHAVQDAQLDLYQLTASQQQSSAMMSAQSRAASYITKANLRTSFDASPSAVAQMY